MSMFYTDKNLSSKFTPKTRKLRLICFRDRMRKILVCVLILQFKGSSVSFRAKYLHLLTLYLGRWAGVWGKLTPMKLAVFMKFTQHQKLVCNSQRVYPRPPNIVHLLCIWVKCAGVCGKITPMKWAVYTNVYPTSKASMSFSKNLPQTSKIFTQIYLPYLWPYATLHWANP